MKKTVVLGASPKKDRISNIAVHRLRLHGHEAVPVGIHEGEIDGLPILTGRPEVEGTDTVTLYLNPEAQKGYYDYILGLHPKRIIFNPGTENPELESIAEEKGIETEEACTLVLLGTGGY